MSRQAARDERPSTVRAEGNQIACARPVKFRVQGCWLLENTHPGAVHFRFEEPDGTPSRWNTLRALRVLRWYDASTPTGSASLVDSS
jgi:hypothetical protein